LVEQLLSLKQKKDSRVKKIFDIFKKQKEPKVIWWSVIDGLEKVIPVVKSKEYIPDWWRKAERFTDNKDLMDRGTIKNCPSMPEFLSQGYVLPLWCDLHITINENGFILQSPEPMFTFSSHNDAQFKNFLPQDIQNNISMVLKPNCPWRVKTPDGWSLMQLPMFYEFNPIFEVLPGVIWSDIHYEINQQMLIKKYGEFELKRGTPLAMYVPYKRVKYKTDLQGTTQENSNWSNESYLHIKTKFNNGYRLNQKNKCPFSKI